MAEILPLRAWRYHPDYQAKIEELTSPLFDVVSSRQREALYKNPLNSIHLSVPKGEFPALNARETLKKWKSEKILVQDPLPGIYVYYQYFRLPGSQKEFCRKGFIIHIKAYDWPENQIFRHENTLVGAVNDRIELLEKTELQASPTHGLYHDESFELEKHMDAAIALPLYDLEDYQGIREVVGVIHDAKIIHSFIRLIGKQKIILADGHHRYEGAITYRRKKTAENPGHTGNEGYNYHMMYLTNGAAKDLRILPTHRLFKDISLSEEDLLKKIEPYFFIRTLNDPEEIGELILHKAWAFGLVFKDSAYKIRLRPERMAEFNSDLPEVVKNLDLSVLHYFFIEKVIGIAGEAQRHADHIEYERNLSRCLSKVSNGTADFAIVTKEVSMEAVLEVCKSGHTMPQKSTYFYPKAISGLIFGSIKEEEFQFPYQVFYE